MPPDRGGGLGGKLRVALYAFLFVAVLHIAYVIRNSPAERREGPSAGDEERARLVAETRRLTRERDRLAADLKKAEANCDAGDGGDGGGGGGDLPTAAPTAKLSAAQPKRAPTQYDELEWATPAVKVETGVRLVRDRWRFERKGGCDPATFAGGGSKKTATLKGATFMTHDVCQLGHVPKDATHLFVHLLQGGAMTNIVFGSACMIAQERLGLYAVDDDGAIGAASGSGDGGAVATTAAAGKKRLPEYGRTWLTATRHWFDAVLEWRATGGSGEAAPLSVLHFDEGHAELCVETLITRDETWRWFPGFRAAWAYRQVLQQHFRLTVPIKQYGRQKLQVSLLKRLEDRRYGEDEAAAFLEGKFGEVATFRTVVFDNKSSKGRLLSDAKALSYKEQMQLLAETDVFVAAHGAALTSIIAMRRGTAVIELFPNNFRYYMFEELARLLSLHYLPHEARKPPGNCKGCEGRKGTPPIADPHSFNGAKGCKKCNIKVSKEDWYYLFKDSASAVWLSMSRRTDIHKFDVRKQK
eukprot:Rhum_TRINITY_DN2158_c0_g1::Rhum_TRINITY_DN2158_c0_g1_i1::g.6092::m.6092